MDGLTRCLCSSSHLRCWDAFGALLWCLCSRLNGVSLAYGIFGMNVRKDMTHGRGG